jgi:hypothetical protein
MKDDADLQKEIRRQSLEALLGIADRHSASDIGEVRICHSRSV